MTESEYRRIVRKARADYRAGRITAEERNRIIKEAKKSVETLGQQLWRALRFK